MLRILLRPAFDRDSVCERERGLVRFVPADRLFTVLTLGKVVEVGNAKFHKIFVRRAGSKFPWWG